MKTRAQFFDGDDTGKWAGEAARQLQVFPPGSEKGGNEFPPLRAKYGIPNDGVGVDFGCGTGLVRPGFGTMNYIGIDQNPGMLAGIEKRWAGRDPKVSAYESPLNKILDNHPQLREVGDLGCFVTVLQHNHWETAAEILDQAHGVLKPGAYLFLMEATYIERHYPKETRLKYGLPDPIDPERLECVDGAAIFTPKGWIHFLGQRGFEFLQYDGDCCYVFRRR